MKISNIINTLKEIAQLPKVKLKFSNIENNRETYHYFTKRHRFKVIRNKTIGVALIDISLYKNFDEYYKTVNGKNSAAYYARKAAKRNYQFVEIDRNNYRDDIYEINTSSQERQGKKMSASYLQKAEYYENKSNYRYYGVVGQNGKLFSYCSIGLYGDFAVVVTLLGHKNFLNEGIMYLMMTEAHRALFAEFQNNSPCRFIMYDTFFGASEGLKLFKRKLGYKPYRVKWIWEK